jgi:ATP-dependent helicase/nuclease subunit A
MREEQESRPLFIAPLAVGGEDTAGHVTGAMIGTAHHRVMEALPLHAPMTQGAMVTCVHSLSERGVLAPEETDALDLEALLQFWNSELGQFIQRNHAAVHRELPFTARLTSTDLSQLGVPPTDPFGADDYLVVQGIVDLAVILTEKIWILDYKTDRIAEADLEDRVDAYRPQLAVYGLALERIYCRPVQKRWLHFLALQHTVEV